MQDSSASNTASKSLKSACSFNELMDHDVSSIIIGLLNGPSKPFMRLTSKASRRAVDKTVTRVKRHWNRQPPVDALLNSPWPNLIELDLHDVNYLKREDFIGLTTRRWRHLKVLKLYLPYKMTPLAVPEAEFLQVAYALARAGWDSLEHLELRLAYNERETDVCTADWLELFIKEAPWQLHTLRLYGIDHGSDLDSPYGVDERTDNVLAQAHWKLRHFKVKSSLEGECIAELMKVPWLETLETLTLQERSIEVGSEFLGPFGLGSNTALRALAEASSRLSNLEVLEMYFSTKDIVEFGNARFSNLRVLRAFVDGGSKYAAIKALASVSTRLEELHASVYIGFDEDPIPAISDEGLVALAEADLPCLKKLEIVFCGQDGDDKELFSHAHLPALEDLKCERDSLDTRSVVIKAFASKNWSKKLRKLSFQGASITPQEIAVLAALDWPRLEFLDLGGNLQVGESALLFEPERMPKLRSLDFVRCYLSEETKYKLIKKWPRVITNIWK